MWTDAESVLSCNVVCLNLTLTVPQNGGSAADRDLRERSATIAREAAALEAGAGDDTIREMQLAERIAARKEQATRMRVINAVKQMPVPRVKALLRAQGAEAARGATGDDLANQLIQTLSDLKSWDKADEVIEKESAQARRGGGGFGAPKLKTPGGK